MVVRYYRKCVILGIIVLNLKYPCEKKKEKKKKSFTSFELGELIIILLLILLQ